MPEGDTIHRTANRLGLALSGRPLARFEARRLTASPGPPPGTLVDRVEARGKYLLIHFAEGTVLETHLKMNGSWHLYRPGERWRRSASSAVVVVEVDRWVAVCFAAPHVVVRAPGATTSRREPAPDHLGPDLCDPAPDLAEVVARIDRFHQPSTPVVEVLLDQRVFCGVGNVFKSEVLSACGLHPTAPLATVDAATRRRLATVAHQQLRANLRGGPRRTVPEGLAVYGRSGKPCRRCRTILEWARHGPHARSTYWCPRCQPAPGLTTPDS